MALIPKLYMDSVVSIGTSKDDTKPPFWVGTGFFVAKVINNHIYVFLVTNKHVFNDYDSVIIRLKEKDTEDLKIARIILCQDGVMKYSVHNDPDIDIAVVALNVGQIEANNLKLSCLNIDDNAYTSQEFIANGGDEGTYVYMLGFPKDFVNEKSNTPICRGGCIARFDPEEISRQKQFLIDIQNFPGNSGSPIITKPEMVSIVNTKSITSATLIGIVNSRVQYRNVISSAEPNTKPEVITENAGLAWAFPVEYIREVVDKELQRVIEIENSNT